MNLKKYNMIRGHFIYSYRNKILSLREYYQTISSSISLDDFKELNKKYREYIIDMIKKLGSIFKRNYNIDFCITLSGSLARNTNDLFSDIDINYLTTSNNYETIIEIEDKINYILQCVLNFRGKDKLHSMVVYLSLIDNKMIAAIDKNEYILNFPDGKIKVKCRNNAEQLMYETYNSTRSINDVIDYFNKHDNEYIMKEWTYCFKFIFNKKYLDLYKQYRCEFRNNINIDIFISSLISDIFKDNTYLDDNIEEIENAKLKHIYKTTVLFNFYKLLAIFYRLDKNVSEFNLDSFYKKSKLLNKYLIDLFNDYLKTIQDLQLILDILGIDLSSHSDELLNINNINSFYKTLTNRQSILKDLNIKKEKLNNECILCLRGIKK